MMNVILVIHLILALAIIAMVLLQRSEGGGLGMGTSGGLGGFASPQATASALTRVTWICVSCFFVTSLVLGILAGQATGGRKSIIDQLDAPAAATAPAKAGEDKTETGDKNPAADKKSPRKSDKPSEPSVPTSE